MFGTNEIVGQKWFDEKDTDGKLFVTSVFITLQGEGPFRGMPAVFVRLAKCNLACGFCDTFFDDGDWFTYQELADKIEDTINQYFADRNIERPAYTKSDIFPKQMVLVMTGGEPTLQKNVADWLLYTYEEYPFEQTQIESNGILAPKDYPVNTTVVISPKCLEKKGLPIKYLKPNPETLDKADCLKFVMEAGPDSPYSEIPDWAHEWHKETGRDIFVSPMNIYNDVPKESKKLRLTQNYTTIDQRSSVDEVVSFWEDGLLDMKANQINHEYTAKYCMDYGYILNIQIHLLASLA